MIERHTYPAGVPCRIVHTSPDPEAARAFYGPLLNWTFTADGAFGWEHVARVDGRAAAGFGHGEPGWTTYVAVNDAGAAAERAEAAGGTALSPPADAGDAGRAALLADPAGARLGVWEARAHAGAQAVNAPGAWSSSDLHTPDRSAAEAFYGAVFGWVPWDTPYMSMWRLPGYGDFLESLDPDDAAARAPDLGGAVLTPPQDLPPVRMTVLRDPFGLPFTLGSYRPG